MASRVRETGTAHANPAATLTRPMAKVCHSCGKGPAFGQSRSHSMVATKRRFDPNLQKVRLVVGPPRARLRLHALPQGRQGHQGRLAGAGARSTRSPPLAARLAHVSDPSLVRFRTVVEGALAHLESRRQEINDLNVFPVADGDTGDNMALTLRAVLAELDRLATEDRPIDEIGRDEIVDSVARAALLGARGNSGVILSQLIRGAAEELISPPGRARRPGARSARRWRARPTAPTRSVREPAEGTILTVMREMAHRDRHRARAHARRAPGPRRADAGDAERADRRHPRARDRGRRGVGPARARAAAGAARGRRRRRRRLRGDDHLRRRRRGAARHRRARSSSTTTRRRRGHPRRARVLDLPLLHELRGHRPGARRVALRSARSRRSATSVLVVGDEPR